MGFSQAAGGEERWEGGDWRGAEGALGSVRARRGLVRGAGLGASSRSEAADVSRGDGCCSHDGVCAGEK